MSKDRNTKLPRDGDLDRARRLVGEAAQLLGQHRPGDAVPLLLKARELEPDNAAAAINLGGAYILQGKHKQAVPVLEAAARLEPDNAMVWTNLAAAYLGKLPFATPAMQDKAIVAFKSALRLDPRAPHVNYNLGLIYMERQDVEQAALHFYAALETDPNDRDAELWLNRIRNGEIGKTEPPEG
ncbi:MAG: tetratricopeptide repeat protein [Anaerolineae bacterium]|jgi:tetratricopeptide (TPR) repeat protein|nr:tetratricopeptide repeat protein [Anaerolineae bacterium]